MIYRGHSSTLYELKPSIGRTRYNSKMEKDIFHKFKQQYYSYTDQRPESDIELLFLAQHYGLPTRLLDWTYNPMIALYFSCEKNDDVDGCIYSIDLHNAHFLDSENSETPLRSIDDIMSIEKPMYIVPNYTDLRYKNQKSLFLLCNLPQKKFTFAKAQYIIKKECKQLIRKELALLGYDKTNVYPLLDSLCSDIKAKYNL